MFKRLPEAEMALGQGAVSIRLDGTEVMCRDGDTVAAAFLASGWDACRETAVGSVPRGPFCMMGVCYDCLVTIDGRPNQQACMTPVRTGMVVERQLGARKVME
jgi:predicted molibdopterin-dependent oxidoreductase YjgC